MKDSAIEWTDHTFNPWIGCSKVSPGCTHCYAETLNKRWKQGKNWGKGAPRQRTSAANWKEPLKWNQSGICNLCGHEHGHECIGTPCLIPICGGIVRRPRVFCASLADWLDDEVKIEDLADLLKLIHACQNLDWQLLTKRPENFLNRITLAFQSYGLRHPIPAGKMVSDWFDGNPPANIWIGTTVENQATADLRIPQLLSIPAKVRFLSCEPLLEAVNLGLKTFVIENGEAHLRCEWPRRKNLPCPIDWVICGGESGPGARPMHPDWARSLRDQCTAAGVPFFFKQWGEYIHDEIPKPIVSIGEDTFYEESKPRRVGKKAAGRQLDGKEWNEVPAEVQAEIALKRQAAEKVVA